MKQNMLFGGDDGDEERRLKARRKATGEELRDEGMQRVLENAGEDWQDQARQVVLGSPGRLVTGETIREMCTAAGVVPHHSNAWGGFIGGLKKSGILIPTGQRVKMRDPISHARKTDVYQIYGKMKSCPTS